MSKAINLTNGERVLMKTLVNRELEALQALAPLGPSIGAGSEPERLRLKRISQYKRLRYYLEYPVESFDGSESDYVEEEE